MDDSREFRQYPRWWVERKRATAGLLTKVRIYAPAIPHVEAEVDLLKTDGLPTEQIMAEAHDFHSRWPKMDEDERRKILELIVKSVVIGNGEITLNLCYLPSFEVMSNGQHML